ncbi:MAG: hypothetical protein LBO66_06745 [Deltaproteobacteria bacterium]|nr:hypothetical protein [Deltaproteobacteria bacterium]
MDRPGAQRRRGAWVCRDGDCLATLPERAALVYRAFRVKRARGFELVL